MSFTVAIVGRPNVGKSTLFNRLVGRRVALVDDRPGVTRDRREGEARLGDLDFTVIDTAGFEQSGAETLSGRMRAQTETAIEQADAVFFVIDARAGALPDDRAFAQLVRKSGKPAVLIANKMEGRAGESGRLDAYSLGLGEPVPLSAEHNEGLPDLYDALRLALPELTAEAIEKVKDPYAPHPIRVAIVGRPNAGKSTLINRLIGEDRLLTSPEAGTTRDSIAVEMEWHGNHFLIHDTAGIRRRSRIDEKLEKLSVSESLNAIRFADVVVVLLDVDNAFEEQDQKIADLVESEGRAVVIAINKWDLKDRAPGDISRLREKAREKLMQLPDVPLVAVSALTGEGLDRLMQAIIDAYAVWNKRIPTSALNRWFEDAVSAHPPPAVSGRRLRLNYITQAKARPPSFIVFCTRADAVPDAYKRYLTNSLREAFEMPGTPVRLTLREKANPFEGRAKRKH
ncbi:ribosome-associated GTPase EngA [Pseudolabrys sp. Root1462]|uniref:ribosome biogenesis GTPase Der n=1 Tax=Pseudolabrys sp. Root1462 TaxID=1736466 RepID=UPI000703C234|nr:ribosome biogenesis GTPase Der [Pseudolabrys sp. Root1462]KQZ01303.1 ribosome-associated GTPase EngA [Pseudolabrys sp. Root1462]